MTVENGSFDLAGWACPPGAARVVIAGWAHLLISPLGERRTTHHARELRIFPARPGRYDGWCRKENPILYVKEDFIFTPSKTLFVECESAAELDGLYEGLSEGGERVMPPADYGFSKLFGAVTDRFGLSCQLSFS